MTALPTGSDAKALSDAERSAVVEDVHRRLAPDVWRDTLVAERAAVTIEDVMAHCGVDSESELASYFRAGGDQGGFEYERLVAAAKDEIAIERAEAKLPRELWRRANGETE